MTPQEAGAALDSALLACVTTGTAVTARDAPLPLPHTIATCAMKSARGPAGAAGEGRATFRVRVVRSEEAPPDRRCSDSGNDIVLRGSASAACGAFDGIDDLLGFSPRSSRSGSSLSSSGTTATHGSGGLSCVVGGGLLGNRTAAVDNYPFDESWSSADERHEPDSAGGAEKSSGTAVILPPKLPTSAAEYSTAKTVDNADAGATDEARGPAAQGVLPTRPDTTAAAVTAEPARAVAGADEASDGGLADAGESSPPGVRPPSPLRRHQGAVVEPPLPSGGSVADSSYSDDGFDNEDDGHGSKEEARGPVAPSLFSFSSASSSASSLERGLNDETDGGDGDATRDEARRAVRQHERDETAVRSAAAGLRRRLLRAIAKCGGGGGGRGGGGEDVRAGARLLFDNLDEVWAGFNKY